jgi:hypothetical protein
VRHVALKLFGLALLNLAVSVAVELVLVPVIAGIANSLNRRRLTAREELDALSIEDLEKSDLPVRPNHSNRKPILVKL